jgi:exopolyphosphatase/guanosine-5'-triphosphate,3'-diphosphate pyrophosphatase
MTLRDGVLVELVRNWQVDEHEVLKSTEDLAPVGRNVSERKWVKELEQLAQRFQTNLAHAQHVAALSLGLFDQLVKQGLDLSADERRYLLASSYLHDIGRIVSDAAHHKHSAYLIRHLPLPGITELESKKIALIALYHRKEGAPRRDPLPWGVGGVHADQVRRVAAILRLVDGLDLGHRRSITSLSLHFSKKQSVLELEQTRTQPFDLDYFRQKASDFETVFGTRLVTFVRANRRQFVN